jgi:pantetheine-phosphate adenylyltransferase
MSGQRIAVCPGSFDPITLGHEDIIRRSLRFADRVIVGVAYSATHVKQGMFDVDERVQMIRETFADEPAVEAVSFQGLLVEFAKAQGAAMIVRGLRAVSDFEYEFQMALMNRRLWEPMETVFLAPDLEHSYLSSSLVRQIASLGGDVSPFVPPPVLQRLTARFAGGAPT